MYRKVKGKNFTNEELNEIRQDYKRGDGKLFLAKKYKLGLIRLNTILEGGSSTEVNKDPEIIKLEKKVKMLEDALDKTSKACNQNFEYYNQEIQKLKNAGRYRTAMRML